MRIGIPKYVAVLVCAVAASVIIIFLLGPRKLITNPLVQDQHDAATLVSTQDQIKQFLATSTKMNLILISIDSLRADHVSLYGYSRETTPALDEWAKGAAIFDNYFSTSFITPISETSVHTGYYPFASGVIDFSSVLDEKIPTLAEVLKKNGWQTAAFSTSPEFWHNGVIRTNLYRGFEVSDKGNRVELNQVFGRDDDPFGMSMPWLDKAKNKNRPFFLWLAFGSVHWPYGKNGPHYFSDPYYSGPMKESPSYSAWLLYGSVYDGKKYNIESTDPGIKYEGKITNKDISYVVDRYDDGVRSTDEMLKRLFDYLNKTGLSRNTIVALQSEHGEGLGERGYILHYDIYDEQTHTPLIIRIPGVSVGHIKNLISGVDVMPTLLGLLKVDAPKTQGASFVPRLLGDTALPRSEVYITRTPLWETLISSYGYTQLHDFSGENSAMHFHDIAIRTDEYKLIHRLSREAQSRWSWLGVLSGKQQILPEYELYDIQSDKGELVNIYENHSGDPIVVLLKNKLASWEKDNKFSGPLPESKPEVQPYF